MKNVSVEEKLYLCRYRPHHVSHITVDARVCNERCTSKICTVLCPAKSYELDAVGRIVVHHENCLELLSYFYFHLQNKPLSSSIQLIHHEHLQQAVM